MIKLDSSKYEQDIINQVKQDIHRHRTNRSIENYLKYGPRKSNISQESMIGDFVEEFVVILFLYLFGLEILMWFLKVLYL